MTYSKIWLVTGAASGIGKHVSQQVLHAGGTVIAVDINIDGLADLSDQYPSSRLIVKTVDVSKEDQIDEMYIFAKESVGRIDVVFSNAGYGIIGEVEGVSVQAARSLFDVNFWGSWQVVLGAIKFFRHINGPEIGGRVLVSSSVLGTLTHPLSGYYCATKYALESVNEALAKELDPDWNIKLTLIEPGMFLTNATKTVLSAPPSIPPGYEKPSLAGSAFRNLFKLENVHGDVEKLAKKIFEVSQLPSPPLRILLGKDAVAWRKEALALATENVREYESWSDDLTLDSTKA